MTTVDRVRNPFTPGAGTQPPELAGREELRETARVVVERVRLGLPTKSLLMVGLRGVGKTVLLDRVRDETEATGIQTVRIEAPENRVLESPGTLPHERPLVKTAGDRGDDLRDGEV